MERQQRTRLVTVLVLGLVFGTGVVMGMAFDRTATATPAEDTGVAEANAENGDDRDEERDDRERRGSMAFQVEGLTAEQQARIDSIVQEFRAAGRVIREERDEVYEDGWEARFDSLRAAWRAEYDERFQPRLDSLVAHTRDAIRSVMTAEQAERYDSLLADYEKRSEERRNQRDSDDARRN